MNARPTWWRQPFAAFRLWRIERRPVRTRCRYCSNEIVGLPVCEDCALERSMIARTEGSDA
jgi:hypothetical protein